MALEATQNPIRFVCKRMTEQESFDESVERQNAEAFGPPEERKRKTAEYCEQLVLDHSEALVREILHALARIFHKEVERRSGGSIIKVDITRPNESTHHRFFANRL